VFAHLIGLVLFALSHGVAVLMSFRVRAERDPRTIGALLGLSKLAIGPAYIGLLLLIIGGLGAAWIGELFGKPWLIASIVVFLVVIAIMYMVATPYYAGIRQALGEPGSETPAATPDQLAAMLDTRRPEVLAATGVLGFVVLVWLMVLKPG
jgi:hypothetical protein